MRLGSRQVRLGRLAAAFSIVALAGCGGGGGGASASATFSWKLFDVSNTSGSALDCAAVGAGDVVLDLTNLGTGQFFPAAATARCVDGAVTTVSVPSGSYQIDFYLYGDPVIYGNDGTLLDQFYDTAPFRPGITDYSGTSEAFMVASLIVHWGLSSASAQGPVSCAPGDLVSLVFQTSGTAPVKSTFDCGVYAGTSYPYPVDAVSADWSLSLTDAAGNLVSTNAPAGTAVLLQNSDTMLGTQLLTVP